MRTGVWSWLTAAGSTVALAAAMLAFAAPTASAALVCPDGYTLNGTVCEKTVPADEVPGDLYCETGELVTDDTGTRCKIEDGTETQTQAADAVETPTCTDGWTLNGTMCEKPAKEDGYYTCDPGWSYIGDGKCWKFMRGVRDATWNPVYTCHHGTLVGQMCQKDPETVTTYTCPDGWGDPYLDEQVGSVKPACDPPSGTWMCSREVPVYRYEDPLRHESTYTCPEGEGPFGLPVRPTDEVQSEVPYCLLTVTPTDDTPVTPGGPTPVTDFCPNLDGVQWENYDCNTGAVAGEVVVEEPVAVAPALPATVEEPEAVAIPAPATVAVPEAATVVPAAVPAGDGSSVPTVPGYVLALLALAGMALAVSAVRVVRMTR